MPQTDIPEDIRGLADARQAARDARDFGEADRLKAEIEAGGWRVVDQRTSYRLQRAYPADVAEPDGRIRYGWSGGVPSRLEASSLGVASVVLVAPDDPDALERVLAGLAGAVSDDVQRVIVANAPGPETETLLARLAAQWAEETASRLDTGGAEVVWLAQPSGAAAALNAGIRRAAAPVVILLDARAEILGDLVTPLATALEDAGLAVAGPWGYVSDDQRHFDAVSAADLGGTDVAAVDLGAMAFRRADYAARGPLDERFMDPILLDVWWSLVLRDPDENEMTPRRAALVDVPLSRPDRDDGVEPVPDSPAALVLRRNRYRIIATFGGRRDLAVARG
jgi:hypothetical protein